MDSVLTDKDIRDSWFSLSLPAQMVNIGNEVKRAFRFKDVSKQQFFLNKAIDYTTLTSQDSKNAKVLDEILIGVEVLNDIKLNSVKNYSREQVIKYYSNFLYFL